MLLVEDDESIADSVVVGLTGAGMEVAHVSTGRAALDALSLGTPDVVLLDLGLPDMDGLDLCKALRGLSLVPIIIVSARGDELDRVLGLELGADDYVVKPFSLRELTARIKAVTRRSLGDADVIGSTPRDGRLIVDERTRIVTLDGATIDLTTKEFDLLAYLWSNPEPCFDAAIFLSMCGISTGTEPQRPLMRTLLLFVKKLASPDWIQAVRGVGFKFVELTV